MNTTLLNILNDSAAAMKHTDGVLGAWNFGSISHGTSDEYSDADIIFLIEGKQFKEMEHKLSIILSQLCDEVVLCWGETFNGRAIISNSYLLQKDNQILQFDVVLLNEEHIADYMCQIHYTDLSEKDIIFDTDGRVRKLSADCPHGKPWNADLERLTATYAFYFHMSAKYLLRQDYFKLNSVMRTLYDTHASLLLTGYDAINWGGTESRLHFLPADKQAHLQKYFCTMDYSLNRNHLLQSMEWFEKDLYDISEKKKQIYSTENITAVKEYWYTCTTHV